MLAACGLTFAARGGGDGASTTTSASGGPASAGSASGTRPECYPKCSGADLRFDNLTGADITRVTFNQAVFADTICPDGKVTSTGC